MFNSVALILCMIFSHFTLASQPLHSCKPIYALARRRGNTQVFSIHRWWNASCLQLNQHSLSISIPLVISPRFVTLYDMHCLPNCHCLHCQLSVGNSIDKCGMLTVLVDMRREGEKDRERGREGGRKEGRKEGGEGRGEGRNTYSYFGNFTA